MRPAAFRQWILPRCPMQRGRIVFYGQAEDAVAGAVYGAAVGRSGGYVVAGGGCLGRPCGGVVRHAVPVCRPCRGYATVERGLQSMRAVRLAIGSISVCGRCMCGGGCRGGDGSGEVMLHTAAAERYAATEPRRVQAEDEERRRSAKGVQRTADMPRAGYGHSGHNYYPCPNGRAGIICLAQYVGTICPMQPDGAAVPAPCPYKRSVLGRATVGAAYINGL